MARSKSRELYADIVIVFKYKHPSASTAKGSPTKSELEQETLKAYEDVLARLRRVGLQYETRPSGRETILIFVLCPWSILKREVVRSDIHDWLKGAKAADTTETEKRLQPVKARDQSLDDLTDSDRIRLTYELIIEHVSEGGAGIFPEEDGFVESVLPLHDWEFNKAWLKSWSTKWVVSEEDLCRIRNHFGEKVAYYFEYLEYYFLCLIVPTFLGILFHFFGSPFSILYSFCVMLWAIVYIESWKRRERELALWWGVKNVRKSENRRHEFQGDGNTVDPITGETVPFFSPWKRWARKIAGLPIIFAGALMLSVLVTLMFVVEVFLEVYYGGYMKEILVYLPTVLFTLAMPYVEDTCNGVARRLTDFENHETNGSYDYHLVQKIFIFKILNSYLSVLLTAFVYIPFGPSVIAILQALGLPFATVAIEPKMLQDRLQAFMISNQLISFFTETIFPWVTRRLMESAAKVQKEVSEVLHHEEHVDEEKEGFGAQDPEEIKRFIKNVQSQVELPVYDVNEDYGEMLEQFGYITLFSVIWPLTGLCAFVNNWIELRSDAAKICFHTRRPLPSRTDSIGPWIDNLEHLAWFSSLTNASILYLFRGTMSHQADTLASPSMLLLCLLASEHVYIGLKWVVRNVLESIPTEAEVKARKGAYDVKRKWLTRLNDASGHTVGASISSKRSSSSSSFNSKAGTSTAAAVGDNEESETISKVVVDCITNRWASGREFAASSTECDLGALAIRSAFKAAS
ncbi:calcium-activated chloride channel-domain-containing protein [Dissophora ornata]|nr:calcium-activated chloride channel-domain-containing protein [Dissophora ornata]